MEVATSTTTLERVDNYFVGTFTAMASPCILLIDTESQCEAEVLLKIAEQETHRIEYKFSRYRSDNVVYQVNHAKGKPVEVDQETALLIDYAVTCYEMSDGMFDITSGVLRRVWKFDGSNRVPDRKDVQALLQHIGWWRVRWENRTLTMPAEMEIDFGGIGKEYAVDRTASLLAAKGSPAFLVNYGGDLFASGFRRNNRAWAVGIDDPSKTGEASVYRLDISCGGIATSGDARRYVFWEGKRLGHILDPKTGWPVPDAAHSITVLARTCMEAGTLSTFAYLQGPRAGEFLKQQGVQFWIL